MLAVCCHETSYGRGWDTPASRAKGWDVGAAMAAHNWGAVQVPRGSSVPSFAWGDSDPDTGAYPAAFRAYPSDIDGAADVARIVVNRPSGTSRRGPSWRSVLALGTWDALAAYMWASGYFAGFGKTVTDRVCSYAGALAKCGAAAALDGVPAPFTRGSWGSLSYRMTQAGRVAAPWAPASTLAPGWVDAPECGGGVRAGAVLALVVGSAALAAWQAGIFDA